MRRRGPAGRMTCLAPARGRPAGPTRQARRRGFDQLHSLLPDLTGDERAGEWLRRSPLPACSSPGLIVSRTARPRCKPRRVVIVQKFWVISRKVGHVPTQYAAAALNLARTKIPRKRPYTSAAKAHQSIRGTLTPTAASAHHGAHRTKAEKSGQNRDRPAARDQIAERRSLESRAAPRRSGRHRR